MEITYPKSVVKKFISTIANAKGSQNSLLIAMSDFDALHFINAQTQVAGLGWLNSLPEGSSFDFIVADFPIGMRRQKVKIGQIEINLRKNWSELTNALHFLSESGTCLALVEPVGFGLGLEGERYEKALNAEGYYVNGIFNTPEGLLERISVRPILILISRYQSAKVFAAELESEEQATQLVKAFVSESSGNSLSEGLLINQRTFMGFTSLKAKQQLSKLETQYKEYDSVPLDDIAEEINTVHHNQYHEAKPNSVYIPMLGTSPVTYDVTQISIKHHNVFQVVLSEKADSEYLSAFFHSDLGKLILNSLTSFGTNNKIRRPNLAKAMIALPSIGEQQEIASTYHRLSSLSFAIDNFRKELALNPRSALAIKLQLENMLEQIGQLTDADKIMNLTRSGESKTVEFKESFSLDLRKDTKEKYIETSSLKTLVAFLNTNGGTLLIGVSDTGELTGLTMEILKFYKGNDKFLLHFKNQLKYRIGEQYYPFINQKIVNVLGSDILMVECRRSSVPCYLDKSDFYVRTNPATDKLEGPKLVEYVRNHFEF